jgi:hypothetical protein
MEYLIGFLIGVVFTYCYIALTYNGHFKGRPFQRRRNEK